VFKPERAGTLRDYSLADASTLTLVKSHQYSVVTTWLSLSSNMIGDEGALEIAHFLASNKSLQELRSSRNLVTPHGAESLAVDSMPSASDSSSSLISRRRSQHIATVHHELARRCEATLCSVTLVVLLGATLACLAAWLLFYDGVRATQMTITQFSSHIYCGADEALTVVSHNFGSTFHW
jgi:hypothetical protein